MIHLSSEATKKEFEEKHVTCRGVPFDFFALLRFVSWAVSFCF
jgi:hypothetical protein